jgi:hypothetical protein
LGEDWNIPFVFPILDNHFNVALHDATMQL